MPNCPVCGNELQSPFQYMAETFSCNTCGSGLRATFRHRTAFVFAGSVIAALLNFAALIVNPRVNPRKYSKVTLALEIWLTRFLWRTKLISIEQDQDTNPSSG